MKKKRGSKTSGEGAKKRIIILISLFIVITLVNLYTLFFGFSSPTGYASSTTGMAMFEIVGSPFINITSPLNISYNFLFDLSGFYSLDLNVSANFEASNWRYYLIDLRHNNQVVWENWAFNPNATLSAVRGGNRLVVYATAFADTPNEQNVEAEVFFNVEVNNTSPVLEGVNSTLNFCEGEEVNYTFTARDYDEDNLALSISPSYPATPFFVVPQNLNLDVNRVNSMNASIVSVLLTKDYVGSGGGRLYTENISLTDGLLSDSRMMDITVVEQNNPTKITNIGVHTIWTSGENSTFYHQVIAEDVEDGNSTDGILGFNLVFVGAPLFGISTGGVMNFTPTGISQVGVYNISMCVQDTGIPEIHPDILATCNQTGNPALLCNEFSLTITDENRPPTITTFYPNVSYFNVSSTDSINFNVTEYDPDGTVPDAYWYVDDNLRNYSSGGLVDEFTYSFGCGISGEHTIRVEVTDGLLNDSVEWVIDVVNVPCIIPYIPQSPGGGGPSSPPCTPEWACGEWGLCQEAVASLDAGILSGRDYRIIKDQCDEGGLEATFCGFQAKHCLDLVECNSVRNKPEAMQFCYYTSNPSCDDKILNCHSGGCEVLVDCGGPCKSCPTCSDQIRNQGEEGEDCGGPCPWKCIPETPLLKRKEILYTFLLIILILVILVIIKLVRVLKYQKRLKESI